MARQADTSEITTEMADIPGTSLKVSRVALGTWAIGGWMWGGTDEAESISTIRAALDHGINVIDTAPAYGFGRSEEIVGKAIAEGSLRSRVVIATKAGLEWDGGTVFRNASRPRILREVEDSLRRLRTDYIDIYQVHWPDPLVRIEETAEAMHTLFVQGKIRAIGVSNFSVRQMEAVPPCRAAACAAVALQPLRTWHRGGPPALLPHQEDRDIRLWRIVPWPAVRTDAAGHHFRSATICAAPTRSSASLDSRNISLPCAGSTALPAAPSTSASSIWRSAGCSIRASQRHSGAHAVPNSCSRSTR